MPCFGLQFIPYLLIDMSLNLRGGFSGIYSKLFLETFDVKRKKLVTFWTVFYIFYENNIKTFLK